MYEMEIHAQGWILHGICEHLFFFCSFSHCIGFSFFLPLQMSLIFFQSYPPHPHPRLTDTHKPTSSHPLSIWSSLLTFSSYRAIPSSIMWGSMRQKESWVRLGPISLASHLSFSSIILTGPFDRPVGNHQPCICCCISPRVSFNSPEDMQNSKATQCPDPDPPPPPHPPRSTACFRSVCTCPCMLFEHSEFCFTSRNACQLYFLWITAYKKCLGGQILVCQPSQI